MEMKFCPVKINVVTNEKDTFCPMKKSLQLEMELCPVKMDVTGGLEVSSNENKRYKSAEPNTSAIVLYVIVSVVNQMPSRITAEGLVTAELDMNLTPLQFQQLYRSLCDLFRDSEILLYLFVCLFVCMLACLFGWLSGCLSACLCRYAYYFCEVLSSRLTTLAKKDPNE